MSHISARPTVPYPGNTISGSPGYDQCTGLLRAALHTPIALMTVVESERQVFLSALGMSGLSETPISHSFCAHVVAMDFPLVIADAPSHPLVMHNPAIAELGVIAYLGVPIHAPGGLSMGALCAIDHRQRYWQRSDLRVVSALARLLDSMIARSA